MRTLVMPAVSFGNVGQLAVDVLIATLCHGAVPVAMRVDSADHLEPLVTCDPFAPPARGAVSTPIEVFAVSDALWVAQIRSVVVPGHARLLADVLVRWAAANGVERVVVLGGASALALDSEPMFDTRDTSRLVTLDGGHASAFPLCAVDQLEFAGLTRHVLAVAADHRLSAQALVRLVFEGDNFGDGLTLARDAVALLGLDAGPLREPGVWNTVRA